MPKLVRNQRMTKPELRAYLEAVLDHKQLEEVVDELASICAERATEAERQGLAGDVPEWWDRACGMLAVIANRLCHA